MGTSVIPDDAVVVDGVTQTVIPDSEVKITSKEVSGEAPDSVSLLSKLMNTSVKDKVTAFLVGGPTAVAGGAKDSEETLPLINGILGGIAGSYLGHPNLGVGAGTSLGEFQRQTVKKVSGEASSIDINDILIKGGAAAASAKILDIGLKTAGLSTKLIPERARVEFFNKTLKAIDLGKKKLSSNFSKSINALAEKYPNQRIDLSGTMKQVKDMLDGIGEDNLVPQLRTAVRNSPKLSEVIDDPTKAIGLTLKESLELKNAITSTTNSIIKKSVKGKTTPNERLVFEVLDNLDNAITKNFPEMRDIRKAYATGKQAYDMARPLLEPGKPVESSIFSKPEGLFGMGSSQFMGSTGGKLAFKDIASMTKPGGKIFEAAQLAHNLNRVADTVGRLGQIAVGGALLRKFMPEDER